VVLITLVLSYFMIVLGELVPKRIALNHSEKVARFACGVIRFVSRFFMPLVWLLTVSTDAVLRLFGINPNDTSEEVTEEPSTVSEEELKQARIEEVVAGWETIPAGTVLAEEEVDLSQKSNYFLAYEISDDVYGVINGKSFQEGTEVTLADIRYIKVLHYNFEHKLQVGELIVATALQEDFINIFMELLDAEYEIQTMYLADNYWTGDPTSTDSASIDENNTSAFLYRPATGSSKLSKHAYGRAIDINPQQNPYVSYKSGSPVWSHENANDYIDRTTGLPHVLTHDDVCYQIFKKYGFTWGGDWNTIKDYQHFEK